eukprot:7389693-Prymnesium_polylepis.1
MPSPATPCCCSCCCSTSHAHFGKCAFRRPTKAENIRCRVPSNHGRGPAALSRCCAPRLHSAGREAIRRFRAPAWSIRDEGALLLSRLLHGVAHTPVVASHSDSEESRFCRTGAAAHDLKVAAIPMACHGAYISTANAWVLATSPEICSSLNLFPAWIIVEHEGQKHRLGGVSPHVQFRSLVGSESTIIVNAAPLPLALTPVRYMSAFMTGHWSSSSACDPASVCQPPPGDAPGGTIAPTTRCTAGASARDRFLALWRSRYCSASSCSSCERPIRSASCEYRSMLSTRRSVPSLAKEQKPWSRAWRTATAWLHATSSRVRPSNCKWGGSTKKGRSRNRNM